MVAIVDSANAADALDGVLVTEAATERVARVRRDGDHAAVAQDFGRLREHARLRILGVDRQITRHDQKASQTGVKPCGVGASRPRSM